jgi:D123
VHQKIKDTITELGGSVVPKLNWSAPKDALHMALSKNSIECRSASDIYLLLKSSIFVTHDLEHAFDDCIDLPSAPSTLSPSDIPYVLVLRPYFKINTSFEFRCFVKDRTLIGLSQRDLKYVGYPTSLIQTLQHTIQTFFDTKLKYTFPDPNFVFDVYLPEPHDRVRLIDINPWAPRTDPLLFSWVELLDFKVPGPFLGVPESGNTDNVLIHASDEDAEDGVEDILFKPEFRIVQKDDPEAYNFGTAPYSAHKLPKEVVDAGLTGGGAMKELLEQWEVLMRGGGIDEEDEDDDDDDDEEQ